MSFAFVSFRFVMMHGSSKERPAASAGVTAAFGCVTAAFGSACGPLEVVTEAGGANCLILFESDTGSPMENQSRNAGME